MNNLEEKIVAAVIKLIKSDKVVHISRNNDAIDIISAEIVNDKDTYKVIIKKEKSLWTSPCRLIFEVNGETIYSANVKYSSGDKLCVEALKVLKAFEAKAVEEKNEELEYEKKVNAIIAKIESFA